MRRQRTRMEWTLYALAAVITMVFALLLIRLVSLTGEVNRLIEADNVSVVREGPVSLRRSAEVVTVIPQVQEVATVIPVPDPMGGAEVVIPQSSAEPEWQFPIAAGDYMVLTSPFGFRVSPLLNIEVHHEGLDISSVWHSQVLAVADGVVTEHWPPPDDYWRGHETYGGTVTILHDNGLSTLYAHMSWTRIHTGDRVRAGQVIGRVGNTGKSDGQHLHIEVLTATGERLNPLLYIREAE